MAVERRLRLDPVACDAFGHCAELVPELIGIDEWGYPVVDGSPIPSHLMDHVDAAVRACPRNALSVQRVDGPGRRRPIASSRVVVRRPGAP
jgi:ferredoxin